MINNEYLNNQYVNNQLCGICLDNSKIFFICPVCRYGTCKKCCNIYFKQYNKKNCPHCRQDIDIKIVVDNHNTFMGIPETRNKMSKFLIKHKKLCVLYCILQINVPCYYLGYSTGVCTVEDIISNYIINVLLGYSILGSFCIILLVLFPNSNKCVSNRIYNIDNQSIV